MPVHWDSGGGQEERVISKSLRRKKGEHYRQSCRMENMWLALEGVEDGDTSGTAS